MKLPSPYICDECGTQKKESNHWWVLLKGIPSPTFDNKLRFLADSFLFPGATVRKIPHAF